MSSHKNKYLILMLVTWAMLYLLYPSWALPVSVISRTIIFISIFIYIIVGILIANKLLSFLDINKPVFAGVRLKEEIRKHKLFLLILISAFLIHIPQLFKPILIIGDETIHLQGGLIIYDYIDTHWQETLQVLFWLILVFALIIRKFLLSKLQRVIRINAYAGIGIVACFAIVLFFWLARDIDHDIILIRYPPLSKLIYFLGYVAFGVHHVVPRFVQLIFYILCSVFIYRTLGLFYNMGTALLGATLYLFLPISFAYANLGELASGTICFISVISFYLLRFLKEKDDRDMFLFIYLCGIGFMYKDPVYLTFPVGAFFIFYYLMRNSDPNAYKKILVLILGIIPVIPWMIITKMFSWRNFTFQMSNFTSADGKLFTYIPLLISNLSMPIFTLFVVSVIYTLIKQRSLLINYFGLLFLTYYFFIVADMAGLSPRFAMTLYIPIVVYVAAFTGMIVKDIGRLLIQRIGFIILFIYLISISAAASVDSKHLNIMNRKLIYFPAQEAIKWVSSNMDKTARILAIRVMSLNFYRVKYNINKGRFVNLWYEISEISTPEKLKSFCKENNIKYIMFPYSPKYPRSSYTVIFEYLKNDPEDILIDVNSFNLDDNYIYISKVNYDKI